MGVSVPIERTIAPGQRIQVNVNGDQVFGTPGNDIFTTLTQISDAVRNDPSQLDALGTDPDDKTATIQTALRGRRIAISYASTTARAKTVRMR